MKPTKNHLSYFSGYLDGDGCFFIGLNKSSRKKQKPVSAIVISSVNKRVLYHFKKIFGGSVSLATKEKGNCRSMYQYTARKIASKSFCIDLLPYLVEKKDQCNLLIQFMECIDPEIRDTLIDKMKIIKDSEYLVSKHHKSLFEKSRGTIKPTEYDFAYLAGFIDAECSLGISKYKPRGKPNYTYKILLQCNNTKYPVFEWLLKRFGGNIHFIYRLKYLKSRKNQLAWRLSAKSLYAILPNIYPFLIHKKPVCLELMKFYETTLKNGGARHTDEFRSEYKDITKIRESIVKKVHKLNLKGIKNP